MYKFAESCVDCIVSIFTLAAYFGLAFLFWDFLLHLVLFWHWGTYLSSWGLWFLPYFLWAHAVIIPMTFFLYFIAGLEWFTTVVCKDYLSLKNCVRALVMSAIWPSTLFYALFVISINDGGILCAFRGAIGCMTWVVMDDADIDNAE